MGNEEVEFSARFGGKARNLYVPIGSILAIYAKENGKGMFFDEDEIPPPENRRDRPKAKSDEPSKPSGKPSLKVVK